MRENSKTKECSDFDWSTDYVFVRCGDKEYKCEIYNTLDGDGNTIRAFRFPNITNRSWTENEMNEHLLNLGLPSLDNWRESTPFTTNSGFCIN